MLMRHRKKNRLDRIWDEPKEPEKPQRPVTIPNNTALRRMAADAIKRLAKRLGIEYTNKRDTIAAIIEVRDNGDG